MICQKAKQLHINPELRICWESTGGKNCCLCEKCIRTILEIYIEGGNPAQFGFPQTLLDSLTNRNTKKIVLYNFSMVVRPSWFEIKSNISQMSEDQIPTWATWVITCNFDKESRKVVFTIEKFMRRVKGFVFRHFHWQ